MSSYNNSLSKKLDEYARLQQEHANSLYEGRESQESYKTATITAAVLRSVAYALHEVCKGEIVPGNRAEEYQINHDIVTNPDFMREVMEGVGESRRLHEEANRAVDPDIFRDIVYEFTGEWRHSALSKKKMDIYERACKALMEHPISPARAVQSKYEGYLEECRQMLGVILEHEKDGQDLPRSIMMDLDALVEGLTDILNKNQSDE